MPDKTSVLVVSLGEWLAWMTHSELRCVASRITVVHGEEDPEGLGRALDRAPFEKVTDDQALLVAVLSSDFLCHARLLESATGADALWLPLQAVSEFVPVSDRGFRLLEGDAERAGCRLSAPRFEELWRRWVDTAMERFDHLRGLAFARVLGFDPASMLAEWCSVIPAPLDTAGASGGEIRERYRATCAFGWAEMLALVGDALGDDGRYRIKAVPGVKKLLDDRKGRFSLAEEDFRAEDALAVASAVEELYRELRREELPSLAVAIVCHYRHIKSLDKELDPKVLGSNLGVIRDRYGEGPAALAAYSIGRYMDDHEVYSLVYATRGREFPALAARELPFDPVQLVPPVRETPTTEAADAVDSSSDVSRPPEKEQVPEKPDTQEVRLEDETKPVAPEEIEEKTAEPDSQEFVLKSQSSTEQERPRRRSGGGKGKKNQKKK